MWPGVKEGTKLGLVGFRVRRKYFLLCTEEALVFAFLPPAQWEKAARMYGATVFVHQGKEYKNWCQIVCRSRDELKFLEFLIQESYNAVR